MVRLSRSIFLSIVIAQNYLCDQILFMAYFYPASPRIITRKLKKLISRNKKHGLLPYWWKLDIPVLFMCRILWTDECCTFSHLEVTPKEESDLCKTCESPKMFVLFSGWFVSDFPIMIGYIKKAQSYPTSQKYESHASFLSCHSFEYNWLRPHLHMNVDSKLYCFSAIGFSCHNIEQ